MIPLIFPIALTIAQEKGGMNRSAIDFIMIYQNIPFLYIDKEK